MTRHRPQGVRPRHLYNPLADEPELADEDRVDGEPLADYYEEEANQIQRELRNPDLTPDRRETLLRHLGIWKGLWNRETIDAHWASGDGDRKLF